MWVGVNANGRMTAGPHQQRCGRLSRYKFRGHGICFEIHQELVTLQGDQCEPWATEVRVCVRDREYLGSLRLGN
jgi:hypothetical protein